MKNIPNIISILRIMLSITLLFIPNQKLLFPIVYFLCGISDLLDGYLARKLHAETKLGAKLDSLSDFIFFASVLWRLRPLINSENMPALLAILLIAMIRLANLLLTRIKFKQWGMIHTIGNKLSGLILFILIPICIALGHIPAFVFPAAALIGGAALEESAILFKLNLYDANYRGLFIR